MPNPVRPVMQAKAKELFRDYDSALCRAATEHQSKALLKEKVNNAARIAASRGGAGKYASGFVRRIMEVSEDPMAIKENLLFVTDSIMRHAERDDPKTAKRFEKAFAPQVLKLFKAALRRSETRHVIAEYMLRKLIPDWRANCWFRRQMPGIIKVLKEPAVLPGKIEEDGIAKPPLSPAFDLGAQEAGSEAEEESVATDFPEAPLEPAYIPWVHAEPRSVPDPLVPPSVEEVPPPDEPTEVPLPGEEEDYEDEAPSATRDAYGGGVDQLVAAMPEHPVPSVSTGSVGPTEVASTHAPTEVATSTIPTPASAGRGQVERPSEPTELGIAVGTETSQRVSPTEKVQATETVPLTAIPPTSAGTQHLPMPPLARRQLAPEPSSPTEVPVPTEVPYDEESIAPTSPVADDEAPEPTSPAPSPYDEPTVVAPLAPAHLARSKVRAPKSPSELPVPTEVPPPTPPGDDEDGPLPPTSPAPPSPTAEAFPTEFPPPPVIPGPTRRRTAPTSPTEMPVPTELRGPRRSVVPQLEHLSTQRVRMGEPSSPTEVPVPTEMPAPTSQGSDMDMEGDDEVPAPTSPAPSSPGGAIDAAPAARYPSAGLAGVLPRPFSPSEMPYAVVPTQRHSSTQPPSSPSEMPVPTEMPSPTSEGPGSEEVEMLLDEYAAASARHQSSTTPLAPGSPTEVPVPTMVPSPTSPAPEEREDATVEATTVVPPSAAASAQRGARAPSSPTEIPVPTDVPTAIPTVMPTDLAAARFRDMPTQVPSAMPTEIPVPTEVPRTAGSSVHGAPSGGSRAPLVSIRRPMEVRGSIPAPSSPTEMPVLTEVPSPTSPAPSPTDALDMPTVVPTVVPSQGRTAQEKIVEAPTAVPPRSSGLASGEIIGSAPAVSSPTEMPVPTEVPSPTSLAPAEELVDVPTSIPPPTAASQRRAADDAEELVKVPSGPSGTAHFSSAIGSVAFSSGHAPSSPTEMPVPTELPSPTSPAPDEAEVPVVAPSASSKPHSSMHSSGLTGASQPLPATPTDMPVPTEIPSPTTPAGDTSDFRGAVPLSVPPPTAHVRARVAPSSPTDMPVPTEMPSPTTPAEADAGIVPVAVPKQQVTARAAGAAPSSPTDMPVPTEMPSPTSPAPDQEDDNIPPVPVVVMPHQRRAARLEDEREVVAPVVQRSRSDSAAAVSSGRAAPSSPTDMPVPTELPSPTPMVRDEEEDRVPALPARPVGMLASARARDEDDDRVPALPPVRPRRHMAPVSVEMESAPPGAPSSPTEMPVPTELPSPTSLAPADVGVVVEDVVPIEQRSVGMGSGSMPARSAPSSPTDMPVPTELPSPTSPANRDDAEMVPQPARPQSVAFGSAEVEGSAQPPSSPTDMPVPTELPSPTSQAPAEEVEVPVPTAVPSEIPTHTTVPTIVPTNVPTSVGEKVDGREEAPTLVPDEVPTAVPSVGPIGPESAAMGSAEVGRSAPSSPTEMPVPTEVEVPTAVPTFTPPSVPTIPTAVPPLAAAFAGSARYEESAPQPPSSPTDMPVPTDVPSPTSPAMGDEATEIVAPLAADKRTTHQSPGVTVSQSASAAVLSSRSVPPPSSPTDMPVPTELPSPTSPAPADGVVDDQEDVVPALRPDHPSAAMASSRLGGSAQPPSSPTDMPVPTELPSPTSPARGDEDDGVPASLPVVPPRSQRLIIDEVEEEQVPMSAAMDSAEMGGSAPAPSSPSEMPVPTDMPSPTSLVPPGEGVGPEDEGLPPMTRSVAHAPASVELARSASAAPSSPTDMPVPTDMPSPTTPVGQKEVEDIVPPAMLSSASQLSAPQVGVMPSSPTDMPVPTDVPSPTSQAPAEEVGEVEVPVPTAVPSEVPTHTTVPTIVPTVPTVPSIQGRGQGTTDQRSEVPTDVPDEVPTAVPPSGGPEAPPEPVAPGSGELGGSAPPGPPSSPTEMPVPTDLPEPTSPAALEEMEEVPTVVPPMRAAPAPPVSAESAHLSVSAPVPSSPTEMPVPTDVPSPTSPAPVEGQAMDEREDVAQMPAVRRSAEPHSAAPVSSVSADIPEHSSPTEMPVPTDVPSPTSPVPADEAADLVTVPTVPALAPLVVAQRLPHATDEPEQVATMPMHRGSVAVVSSLISSGLEGEPVPSSPTELPVPGDVASPTSPVLPGEAADIPEDLETTVPMLYPLRLSAASGVQEEQEQVATLPYEVMPKRRRRGPSPISPMEIPVPRQPGTPTYTPTDDVFAPGTPVESAGALVGRHGMSSVGRSSAGHDTAGSSPTYIMEEVVEEPLPPTPTYTGSSPTYLDELEPPTPTLEADDDELYGKEDEVVSGAFPGIRFMRQIAPGTPPPVLGQPAGVAAGTSTHWVRLPGLESPTPTYEPDDEEFYGTASSGSGPAPPPTPPPPLPSSGAHSAKRQRLGTPPSTPQSGGLPGTPLSVPVQPGTPQSQAGAGPGTPHSHGGTATPTRAAAAAALSSGAVYDPFAVPGAASGAAASSGGPAVPPLASEVFGERAGKRKGTTASTGGEELPPWKRRERRRKQ
mmetsp:Transcript_25681/g.64674  ORF Transcript_25681/g.64674 Transcript_25681/m.64674 type:complete len:2503 (-) Transcript_25681:77-7585(-)